jgi:hypothetical protein
MTEAIDSLFYPHHHDFAIVGFKFLNDKNPEPETGSGIFCEVMMNEERNGK